MDYRVIQSDDSSKYALGALLIMAQQEAPFSRVEQGASALARQEGYTGYQCPGCEKFTLVKNGIALKCTTCGDTYQWGDWEPASVPNFLNIFVRAAAQREGGTAPD